MTLKKWVKVIRDNINGKYKYDFLSVCNSNYMSIQSIFQVMIQ